MISVVSPVYMAGNIVDELVRRLKAVLAPLGGYEIILIDDCSGDDSWERLKAQEGITALRNERNIGQHATIHRGVESARGEWIVVMDCDLQDDPADIPHLYAKALEGYDIVYARRCNIKQNRLRRFFSVAFHKIYSLRKGTKTDPAIANFAVYRKGCYGRRDCSIAVVDVEHCPRYAGRSSYTPWKLIKLFFKLLR